MSNEKSITEAVKQFNASLQLMEAIVNDKPISQLGKLTVQHCCEDIIEECERLFRKMED